MANINDPRGAYNLQTLNGNTWNGKLWHFTVPSTDATDIFIGDLVKMPGTCANNELNRLLPVVDKCGYLDFPIGIVCGFLPVREYEDIVYRQANTLRTALACTDPFVVFEMQTNGIGTIGDVGQNITIESTLSGDPITGLSLTQLDQTTITPTNPDIIRIMRLSPRIDNEIGLNCKWLCKFNLHQLTRITGV